MGLDPAYATSVASMISHNPFAKQPAWPGTPPTDADPTPPPKGKAKTPALVKQEAEGGDETTAQPKKKARAPKPPATGQQYIALDPKHTYRDTVDSCQASV